MTKLCKHCKQETPETQIAHHYANKNFCLCKTCMLDKWRNNNKKRQTVGLESTYKHTLGATYRFRPNTPVEDKMDVFLNMILDCEDAGIRKVVA